MKFSIFIPQLFYDLIARVLPGFFFLILILFGTPMWAKHLQPLTISGEHNLFDSLGNGIGYAVICYFLGWLFFAFTWGSKRDVTCKKYGNSIDKKYQWIRLYHSAAGFRFVKLRAEARMLEATRTAMLFVVIVCLVYLLVQVYCSLNPNTTMFWAQPLSVITIAVFSYYGFRKCEKKAWDNYWGNINIIYRILHDSKDPVKLFTED